MALGLGAGCVASEKLEYQSEVPEVEEREDRFGYRGDVLQVTRSSRSELVGGLDGAVASQDGQWAHLSMADITCAMTGAGVVTYDFDLDAEAEEETVGTGPGDAALVASPGSLFVVSPERWSHEEHAIAGVVAGTFVGERAVVVDDAGGLHWLGGVSVALPAFEGSPDVAALGDRVLVAAGAVVAVSDEGEVDALPLTAERLEVDGTSGLILAGHEGGVQAVTESGALAWELTGITALDVGVLSDLGVAWVFADLGDHRRVLLVEVTSGADLGYLDVPDDARAFSSSVEGGLLVQRGPETVTLFRVNRL